MAVITKYIVVRDGVELDQVFADKKEAEAYDKMLDAAQDLSSLIKQGDLPIELDAETIGAVAIYLAKHAPAVTKILKSVKPFKPSAEGKGKDKTASGGSGESRKKTSEPKAKAGSKAG